MGLSFGTRLADVTADADELEALLSSPAADGEGEGGQGGEDLAADPDPGWGEEGLRERLADNAKAAAGRASVKVTAAVRKDVRAKVALGAGLLAGAWEARDPWCGQAAVESVPAFSEAVADILCDSPDIVRWFTSGGGFMKWLNVVAALQPVGKAVWQHHVAHSVVEDPEAGGEWAGYAA